MRAKLFAALIVLFKFPTAVLALLWPGFWLARRVNPASQRAVFRRRRDAALFRVDMLGQNLLDRPIGRARWVAAIARDCATASDPAPSPRPLDALAPGPGLDDQFRSHFAAQRPAVIRGLLHGASGFRPWDFDAFLAAHGDEEVTLACPALDGYAGALRELQVPGVYLHNSEILVRRHPRLLLDAGFDLVARTLARELRSIGVVQLFAGRRQTGSVWHCAGGMNLFLMLTGRKRWRFIDPADSPLLFPRTQGLGRSTYYFSDSGAASAAYRDYAALLGEGTPRHDEDLQARAFARCQVQEVVLEPGDVLFVPAWWWHDVENLGEASIGMATRWAAAVPRVANPTFDVAGRLNLPYFYRMARALASQRVVARGGVLDLAAVQGDPEHLREVATPFNRGNGLGAFLSFESTVADYYARQGYGALRGTGDQRSTSTAYTP